LKLSLLGGENFPASLIFAPRARWNESFSRYIGYEGISISPAFSKKNKRSGNVRKSLLGETIALNLMNFSMILFNHSIMFLGERRRKTRDPRFYVIRKIALRKS